MSKQQKQQIKKQKAADEKVNDLIAEAIRKLKEEQK